MDDLELFDVFDENKKDVVTKNSVTG